MHKVERNLSQLFSEFEPSLDYLLKVSGTKKSERFHTIHQNLSELVKHYDPITTQLNKDASGKEVFLSAHEATDLIEIAQFLRKQNQSNLPIKSIRRILLGPAYHVDEISEGGKTDPRNIQFELYLAAKLNLKGSQILGYEDVVAQVNDFQVSIECKRPLYENRILGNFEKAIEQLRKKDLKASNRWGFVALSLDKAFGTDNVLMTGGDINPVIERLKGLKEKASKRIDAAKRLPREDRVVGVIYLTRTFLWNKRDGQFSPVSVFFTERTNQDTCEPEFDRIRLDLHARI